MKHLIIPKIFMINIDSSNSYIPFEKSDTIHKKRKLDSTISNTDEKIKKLKKSNQKKYGIIEGYIVKKSNQLRRSEKVILLNKHLVEFVNQHIGQTKFSKEPISEKNVLKKKALIKSICESNLEKIEQNETLKRLYQDLLDVEEDMDDFYIECDDLLNELTNLTSGKENRSADLNEKVDKLIKENLIFATLVNKKMLASSDFGDNATSFAVKWLSSPNFQLDLDKGFDAKENI